MKRFLLIALGCLLLAGCANPVEKVVSAAGSVARAGAEHSSKLAQRTAEKTEEQILLRGAE